jgi:hypothetical protein
MLQHNFCTKIEKKPKTIKRELKTQMIPEPVSPT